MEQNQRRGYKMNKLSPEALKTLETYIKSHPDATFSVFVKDIGGKVKCSDAHYYFKRRELLGPSNSPHARRNGRATLYKTVWSYPSIKVSPGAKEVIKDLIEKLNLDHRGHFTLIEMKDPAVIELRDSHRG